MAAGCPVIAARAGGIPDIVTDGVNGCLFEPDDPNGLTRAALRLLDSSGLRDRLRDAARLEAERWSWSAATDALRDYYRGVLDGRSLGDGHPPTPPMAAPPLP